MLCCRALSIRRCPALLSMLLLLMSFFSSILCSRLKIYKDIQEGVPLCTDWLLCGSLVIEFADPDPIESQAWGIRINSIVGGQNSCVNLRGEPSDDIPEPPWDGCHPSWIGCSTVNKDGYSCNQIQDRLLEYIPPSLINQWILSNNSNPCRIAVIEWGKHGRCMGFDSARNYTREVASLGKKIVHAIMKNPLFIYRRRPLLFSASANFDEFRATESAYQLYSGEDTAHDWDVFISIFKYMFHVTHVDANLRRLEVMVFSPGRGYWYLRED